MTHGLGAGAALLLGLIQGLTEFLPISSSAHIRIVSELLTGADAGAAFTAVIQLGTESAVLLYFRRDIARICTHWWRAVRGDLGSDWRSRLGAPAGAPTQPQQDGDDDWQHQRERFHPASLRERRPHGKPAPRMSRMMLI